MKATIQWLAHNVGLIRVHPDPDGHWIHRSPYTWSAVLYLYTTNAGVATIMGASRAPTLQELRALRRLAQDLGLRQVGWDRVKGDTTRHKRFTKWCRNGKDS